MKTLALALAASVMLAQTKIDLQTQAKRVDFSQAESTKPFKTGAVLPPVCSTGEAFLLLTASAGKNLNTCIATNIWSASTSSATEFQIDGTPYADRSVHNYVVSDGMVLAAADSGSAIQISYAVDSATIETRANAQTGGDLLVITNSADGILFAALMQPALGHYSDGMVVQFRPNRNCAASPVLDIDTLGPMSLMEADGSTRMTCESGGQYTLWFDAAGDRWRNQTPALPKMNVFTTTSPGQTASALAVSSSAGRVVGRRIYVPASLTINAFDLGLQTSGVPACRTGVAVFKLDDSLNGTLIAGAASQDACDGTAGIKTLITTSVTLLPGEYYVAIASTSTAAAYAGVPSDTIGGSAHLGSAVAPLFVQSAAGIFNGTNWPSTLAFSAAGTAGSHIITIRR